jgi:general secretion pathway protein J
MRTVHASSGRRRRAATRGGGFTLLELLVAITILAFIAVIAWRGLSSLTATRERLEPQSGQMRELVGALGQMELDLARVPLNGTLYALPTLPLHITVVEGRRSLQILRLAEAPDGSGASAVQFILYRVHDGVLQRQATPAQRFYSADAPARLDSVDLLHDVDDVQYRVWRSGVGWFVPNSDLDTVNATGLEVRLQRHDGTFLRRVFIIG